MPKEYAKLKSLLLQDEMDQMERLTKELRALEQTQEKDILVERLSQIITDILSKSLQNNQQQLYATLQPILSKSVADELYRSKDLKKILFPIITSAIGEQVHQQRESIVDALYPIMGNMISKYVSSAFTDMMYEINNTLQSSLSLVRIKRKIKSKLYGISEAQLLLQETDFVTIETVFLIHKESGLLIVDLHKEGNQRTNEVEMVASMLSAIRSFVNDWISSDQEMSEIREIEYGNSSIAIESAGSCYLAVVTSNHADMKDRLSKVLSRVVSKHSEALSAYDGDTSQLDITNIKAILSTLFDSEKETTKEKFPLLASIVLFLLFALPLGWYGYNYYQAYQIEKNEMEIASILQEHGIKVYDFGIKTIKDHQVLLNGIVLSQEDNEKIDSVLNGYSYVNQINSIDSNFNKNYKIALLDQLVTLANQEYNSNITHRELHGEINMRGLLMDKKDKRRFIDQIKALLGDEKLSCDIDSLPQSIKRIVDETNKKYHSNIAFHQEYDKIRFTGLIIDEKAREKFEVQIQKAIGSQKFINEVEVLPRLDESIYFAQGSSKISPEYNATLDRISSDMKKHHNYYVKIVGYTDIKGTHSFNKLLSKKRVLKVEQALVDRGVNKEMMIVKATGKPPEAIGEMHDKEKESRSRCVAFNWEIKSGD